jgi:3-oxoacyl-[acyl-carrier protein] reductase
MSRFTGAKVVVTGASRGLGRAVAAAFAREGAEVFVGFRVREADAERTVAEIGEAGGRAVAFRVDVRDPADVERAFAALREQAGHVDVLVNNAGVSRDGLFPMQDEEAWNDVLSTNLMGTARCCRAALGTMWRARSGVIVNVASLSAIAASPGQVSYAASKAGVIALTRTLAAELAPRGIRVNAVVPGLLATGMAEHLDSRIAAERLARIPLGRLGTAEEAARAVLFLASEEASYVVGQALIVDGGMAL